MRLRSLLAGLVVAVLVIPVVTHGHKARVHRRLDRVMDTARREAHTDGSHSHSHSHGASNTASLQPDSPQQGQDSLVAAAQLQPAADQDNGGLSAAAPLSADAAQPQTGMVLSDTDARAQIVEGTPFGGGCADRKDPSFASTTCCGGQSCAQPSGVCCTGYCCPTLHTCVPLLDKCGVGIPAPVPRPVAPFTTGKATHLVPEHPFQLPPALEEPPLKPEKLDYPKMLVPDIPKSMPPKKLPPLPPVGFMADVQPIAGGPWPPVGALSNDGSPGMWAKRDMVDWRGYGLIRNGTQNVLPDLETCQDQCQAMSECRLVFWDRITHECWLDSKFADVPRKCPDSLMGTVTPGTRAGLRAYDPVLTHDCITFFKKVKEEEEMVPQAGRATIDRKDWVIKNGLNFNGPAKRALIRNGRRNIVASEEHCVEQCSELKYCRTMVFFRSTMECWLSSRVAFTGVKCAMRRGRRSCISWIKKLQPAELEFIKHTLKWQGRHPSTAHSGIAEEEEENAVALANAAKTRVSVKPHIAGGVQIKLQVPK